ncbi:head-tail connector protein [Mesorhizobium sp. CAU 1732]|uniref:head-tail connector protein n=1 Tax=Mesorhizobium sp. CAU 1732 TaxID=3140358 RepID=UPI003261AEB3
MALFRTVEPELEPVTLTEIKQQLRVAHDSEDVLLLGLIRAAREEVEASCGLALMNQSWRLTIDRMPASGRVLLHRHPVREIPSVTVYGADGEGALVDPSALELDAKSRPARLHVTQPLAPSKVMNGIEIDFTAGFGEAGTDVPDLLKRAIHTLVAHWYEFRASFDHRQQPMSLPPIYERLVAPYRMRRL